MNVITYPDDLIQSGLWDLSKVYNTSSVKGQNNLKFSVHSFSGCSTRGTFELQYTPWNMHTVFALLCFVVVIHWLLFPYPSGLLHWHCGNLTIAPVPAKQPWWIWINTSCEYIMNDCISTTKQSTTKPCAYFLGYTVSVTVTSKCSVLTMSYWTAVIGSREKCCGGTAVTKGQPVGSIPYILNNLE